MKARADTQTLHTVINAYGVSRNFAYGASDCGLKKKNGGSVSTKGKKRGTQLCCVTWSRL